MCRLCSHISPAQKSSAGLLPVEGGSYSSSCSTGDTKANPVTLTSYSSPPKAAIPQPSGRRPVAPFYTTRRRQAAPICGASRAPFFTAAEPPPQPSAAKPLSNLRTLRTLGPKARQPSRRQACSNGRLRRPFVYLPSWSYNKEYCKLKRIFFSPNTMQEVFL